MINTKSIKTTIGGLALIIAGTANLVIFSILHKTVTAEAAGICATAWIGGITLMNAKDDNVSNSPIPMATAQKVTIAAAGAK